MNYVHLTDFRARRMRVSPFTPTKVKRLAFMSAFLLWSVIKPQAFDTNFALAKFVGQGLAKRKKEAKARFRPFLSGGAERCPSAEFYAFEGLAKRSAEKLVCSFFKQAEEASADVLYLSVILICNKRIKTTSRSSLNLRRDVYCV